MLQWYTLHTIVIVILQNRIQINPKKIEASSIIRNTPYQTTAQSDKKSRKFQRRLRSASPSAGEALLRSRSTGVRLPSAPSEGAPPMGGSRDGAGAVWIARRTSSPPSESIPLFLCSIGSCGLLEDEDRLFDVGKAVISDGTTPAE